MYKPVSALCTFLLACPLALAQTPAPSSMCLPFFGEAPKLFEDELVRQASGQKASGQKASGQQASGQQASTQQVSASAQTPTQIPNQIPSSVPGAQNKAPGSIPSGLGTVQETPGSAGTAILDSKPGETSIINEFDGSAGSSAYGNRVWMSLEYLLWWIKDGGAPPLVTTSTVPGNPGLLGAPGTVTLFSGNFDYGTFSGGRLSGGWWFNREATVGLEASAFMLEHRSVDFSMAGDPVLSRPYFDTFLGKQGAVFIASPGAFNGAFEAFSGTRFWGSEVNFAFRPDPESNWKVLAGFRYLDLNENLNMYQQSTILPGALDFKLGMFLAPGTTENFTDVFLARNQFYGGQLGLQRYLNFGPVSLFLSGKIALGATHEVVDVAGTKSFSTGAAGLGGIASSVANIGRQTQNPFTAIPELEARINYQLTQRVKAFVGYNYIYWADVVRPGNQVDLLGNSAILATNTIIGPAHPAPQFNKSDFWAQGVTFGLLFQY